MVKSEMGRSRFIYLIQNLLVITIYVHMPKLCAHACMYTWCKWRRIEKETAGEKERRKGIVFRIKYYRKDYVAHSLS